MLMLVALLAAISTAVSAQGAAQSNPLLTLPGWEAGGQFAEYQYEEPSFAKLTGDRIGVAGAYTSTGALLYTRIDLRASYGSLDYQGSGTLGNVPDWIFETRAVFGKDFLTAAGVALSPYIGLGYRYLYNDVRGRTSTGAIGYRRHSNYVYAPMGLTVRINAGSNWAIAPTIEYDVFLTGRQVSKLSDTSLGFSDLTNKQAKGRGYRAYLMLENERWAFGPWAHYWKIEQSDIRPVGLGFIGLEPANRTRDYGVEVRYRF